MGAAVRIGPLTVEVPVLLAPMAAVTDLPFRTVCEEAGVGLTITEFLSAHALSAGAAKTVDKLTPSLDGRRLGAHEGAAARPGAGARGAPRGARRRAGHRQAPGRLRRAQPQRARVRGGR